MRDRFLHREAAQIAVGGLPPIGDGLFVLARRFELLGDHLRGGLGHVRKSFLQHKRDCGMQLLAPRAQHGGIGAVLHQRVLEDIDRVRRRAAQEDEFGFGEPDQRVLQHRIGKARDRGQNFVGEFPSDRGPDLQNLACGTEAVDARHQRGLQRGGNSERLRRLFEQIAIAGLLQLFAFEQGLGELFDEQRHPVGPVDDLIEQSARQFLAARDVADQRCPVALRQPAERQHGDVRLPGPRRLKFRPEGDDEQDRERLQSFDGQRQEFDRRRVAPMRVLEQHQNRPALRQGFEPVEQHAEEAAATPLRVRGRRPSSRRTILRIRRSPRRRSLVAPIRG